MITKEIAINLKHGQTLVYATLKNADKKTPVCCRVNGKTKVWKTRPNEFQIPVKHGRNTFFYITEFNAAEWSVI